MTTPLALTPKEVRLIEYVRALGFGTLRLVVVDSQPDRIEEALKSTKL